MSSNIYSLEDALIPNLRGALRTLLKLGLVGATITAAVSCSSSYEAKVEKPVVDVYATVVSKVLSDDSKNSSFIVAKQGINSYFLEVTDSSKNHEALASIRNNEGVKFKPHPGSYSAEELSGYTLK